MISSYSDLIQASYSQQEPQRLLFVFCRAELPDEASPEEKAAFERGERTLAECVREALKLKSH